MVISVRSGISDGFHRVSSEVLEGLKQALRGFCGSLMRDLISFGKDPRHLERF